MSFEQVQDFLEESEVLYAVLRDLDDDALMQPTQFKGWTIEDVLRHLHFWNRAVDFAAKGEEAFEGLRNRVKGAFQKGIPLREVERKVIPESGRVLRATWIGFARAVAMRWEDQDPRARLPGMGSEMSARSAMTARQMETWAHGFEVFDVLGRARVEHDRIRNIVVLGVNTFGWSHKVQGLDVPTDMPAIRLEAPSGEVWEYGGNAGKIEGTAADFAAVVTQARALADTGLMTDGEEAETWMAHAQCFAGLKEVPPAPGARGKA